MKGLGRNPVSPLESGTPAKSMMVPSKSGMVTPNSMKKRSGQTCLKNMSSLGRFGVISHHYDE